MQNGMYSDLTRRLVFLGGANMFLAVALGAFGAHALKAALPPEGLAVYHTANLYHFWHALGLFCVALAAACGAPPRLLSWSGGLIQAGIILFSGSLYLLGLTGRSGIGAVTPFGGIAFLAGWALLCATVLKRSRPRRADRAKTTVAI